MNSDRINPDDIQRKLPKPEIKILVDGQSVFKPGMRTYLVESLDNAGHIQGGDPESERKGGVVTYTVCSCNTVAVCSCNKYTKSSCSCNNKSTGSSRCSCNKVH